MLYGYDNNGAREGVDGKSNIDICLFRAAEVDVGGPRGPGGPGGVVDSSQRYSTQLDQIPSQGEKKNPHPYAGKILRISCAFVAFLPSTPPFPPLVPLGAWAYSKMSHAA